MRGFEAVSGRAKAYPQVGDVGGGGGEEEEEEEESLFKADAVNEDSSRTRKLAT